MSFEIKFILFFTVLCSAFHTAFGVRCYQCASSQEPKGQDSCGAYNSFNKDEHIPVECNSDESHTPGSFCMKIVQQGPLGFVWDGRWRQVIRRCASVAETGVSGVCNWGIYENGVYWEECYCAEDGCNGTCLPDSTISTSPSGSPFQKFQKEKPAKVRRSPVFDCKTCFGGYGIRGKVRGEATIPKPTQMKNYGTKNQQSIRCWNNGIGIDRNTHQKVADHESTTFLQSPDAEYSADC